jgi:DUF4097 and DUF4098 domain-containing protein YvlB
MNTQQQEQTQAYTTDTAGNKTPSETYYEQPQQNQRNLATIFIVVGVLWLAMELFGFGIFMGRGRVVASEVFSSNSNLVVLDLDIGDLVLEAEDRDDISVEVVQRGIQLGSVLSSDQNNSRLKIENHLGGFCFGNCTLSYRVAVPSGTALEIQTSSGEVQLEGNMGALQLSTSSGSIEIQNSNGPVEVQTSSGDIVLQDIQASVVAQNNSGNITVDSVQGDTAELSTSSGNIYLENAQLREAEIKTTSGNAKVSGSIGKLEVQSTSGQVQVENEQAQQINLQSRSGNIRYRGALTGNNTIENSSGNVDIQLNDAKNLNIHLSTGSGSLNNAIGLNNQQSSEQEIRGSVGDGSVKLTVTTGSGNIQLDN